MGFRPFIYRSAVKYGLAGYVRNMGDAGVEVLLEGNAENIERFQVDLSGEKPPLARIDQVHRIVLSDKNEYHQFTIIPSSSKTANAGSIIPPDIAICNPCLRELRDPNNPRYDYFAITCTDCGPRFTIVERLPYDRENTTLKEFSLCSFCKREYEDSANRRFHAQTLTCPPCGPKAYLTTHKGKPVDTADPIRLAGKLVSEGKILAIKGYGGFHIAASTTLETPLLRLREAKHRKEKPFAIMARSLEATKTFANVGAKEQKLLTSPQRPIVLLNKGQHYNLSSIVAPHLHNIGVMLPYTGLHHMLFDDVADPAFVMTSANPANQPIVKDNDSAIEILGTTVDYFLLHNRKIAHRCDDSVMRVHDTHQAFLRKSRGYAPAPLYLKKPSKHCIVALGGELNNTSAILYGNKAFISQHIGDVENIETETFLCQATRHLQHLTNTHAEAIACDLHPKFNTTRIAKELAEAEGLPLVQVQHHHAHAAALMAEHSLDDIIAVVCDGYGYGLDGAAWGGEILYCISEGGVFWRVGNLEPQPLLGGDLASRYPLRVAAGILHKAGISIECWLNQNSSHLPHGTAEAQLITQQLKTTKDIVKTTSCGRVLDAAAAVLGVCFERSYEGEPAMKLESTALVGEDALGLKPLHLHGNVLDTTCLLKAVHAALGRVCASDLAYAAHVYLARGLAEIAIQNAAAKGTVNVGFTGGAACNQLLVQMIRQTVEAAGLEFFVHDVVPAGDGGVSFGQAVVASKSAF